MSALERIGAHEVHPVASIFPLLDEVELRALAEDIRQHGLREPVVRIWAQDPAAVEGVGTSLILDGRNRLRACELARVATEFSEYTGPSDTTALLAYVKSRNLARRHLDESARAMVAARALTLYEKAAKERMRAGGKAPKGGHTVPDPGRARDAAAIDFGVSGRLVQAAKTVLENAEPEVIRSAERGELAVSAAADLAKLEPSVQREVLERARGRAGSVRSMVRQHERARLAEQIEREPTPAPKGPFRVIVVDPPWPYESRNDDGTHRGVMPYPPMSIEAICMLGVEAIAHEDAALLLWTTNQFLDEAFDVARAWDFEQKTMLTWVKDKMGLGNYLRNQTEHCLLCIRGKPTLTLTNQTTILRGPVREHSRKPDEFYELVESLCPGSKVELFAREPRPGWARWGAEAEKFGRTT